MLPRAEWEAELRYYGCDPLEGKGSLNTAELWQMPWERWPFTVPLEDNSMMHMATMDRLRLLIVGSAPKGTQFPYDPSCPTGLRIVE
jgi:hypothetical protein